MRHTLALCLLALAVPCLMAQSQLGTGAISGVVQDASAAVITDAQVTITNVETGLVRSMLSGSGGQFLAPVLPPGRYQLRVSKAGFTTLEQDDIVVNVGGTRPSPPC